MKQDSLPCFWSDPLHDLICSVNYVLTSLAPRRKAKEIWWARSYLQTPFFPPWPHSVSLFVLLGRSHWWPFYSLQTVQIIRNFCQMLALYLFSEYKRQRNASLLKASYVLKDAPCISYASLVAQTVKCLPIMRKTRVRSLGGEDPQEKEMATHSSTLAWRIPWEEPGRLESMGSQRVGHDWATLLYFTCISSKTSLYRTQFSNKFSLKSPEP